eukprot:scaffold558_cov120-Isochrysis_galbana.AAC.6
MRSSKASVVTIKRSPTSPARGQCLVKEGYRSAFPYAEWRYSVARRGAYGSESSTTAKKRNWSIASVARYGTAFACKMIVLGVGVTGSEPRSGSRWRCGRTRL